MPGRFFLTRSLPDIATALDVAPSPELEITPRRNMSPGEEILVLTEDGLTMMRWGIIPVGRKNARGRPVMETIINARSETVFDKSAFDGVKRAVIPVDGWYEWTGEKRKKTAWAIAPKSGDLLYFAAITDVWSAPGGTSLWQVAAVTCPPNKDVKDIHHRMGVLLRPEDIPIWMGTDEAAAKDLMQPWPDGLLDIHEATDVDWTQP